MEKYASLSFVRDSLAVRNLRKKINVLESTTHILNLLVTLAETSILEYQELVELIINVQHYGKNLLIMLHGVVMIVVHRLYVVLKKILVNLELAKLVSIVSLNHIY